MSDDEAIIVPTELLRAVFDIAVGSAGFGSGFLDQEEVDHLRACAVALGIDPLKGTPDNLKCQYIGGHEWVSDTLPFSPFADRKDYCNRCRSCREWPVKP